MVVRNGYKLVRMVEMYQWKERKEEVISVGADAMVVGVKIGMDEAEHATDIVFIMAKP